MGVKLGYGTDAGVYPHGLNARQFANMVKYGMTEMLAIQSATGRASEEMGRTDIGAIVPDRYADRKSVVEGKSVSVRVDLGGRSLSQKKKKKNSEKNTDENKVMT